MDHVPWDKRRLFHSGPSLWYGLVEASVCPYYAVFYRQTFSRIRIFTINCFLFLLILRLKRTKYASKRYVVIFFTFLLLLLITNLNNIRHIPRRWCKEFTLFLMLLIDSMNLWSIKFLYVYSIKFVVFYILDLISSIFLFKLNEIF